MKSPFSLCLPAQLALVFTSLSFIACNQAIQPDKKKADSLQVQINTASTEADSLLYVPTNDSVIVKFPDVNITINHYDGEEAIITPSPSDTVFIAPTHSDEGFTEAIYNITSNQLTGIKMDFCYSFSCMIPTKDSVAFLQLPASFTKWKPFRKTVNSFSFPGIEENEKLYPELSVSMLRDSALSQHGEAVQAAVEDVEDPHTYLSYDYMLVRISGTDKATNDTVNRFLRLYFAEICSH